MTKACMLKLITDTLVQMDFLKHFSYIRFQKAENAKLSYFVKKFNEFMDLLFKGVKKTKQNCVAR